MTPFVFSPKGILIELTKGTRINQVAKVIVKIAIKFTLACCFCSDIFKKGTGNREEKYLPSGLPHQYIF
jgi:hypothetical protein